MNRTIDVEALVKEARRSYTAFEPASAAAGVRHAALLTEAQVAMVHWFASELNNLPIGTEVSYLLELLAGAFAAEVTAAVSMIGSPDPAVAKKAAYNVAANLQKRIVEQMIVPAKGLDPKSAPQLMVGHA